MNTIIVHTQPDFSQSTYHHEHCFRQHHGHQMTEAIMTRTLQMTAQGRYSVTLLHHLRHRNAVVCATCHKWILEPIDIVRETIHHPFAIHYAHLDCFRKKYGTGFTHAVLAGTHYTVKTNQIAPLRAGDLSGSYLCCYCQQSIGPMPSQQKAQ
jgi:hypothetical protein